MNKGLVWLRRDLRAHDHAALSAALRSCDQVWITFIFDSDILEPLSLDEKADRRVDFIWQSLKELDGEFKKKSGKKDAGIIIEHGKASTLIPEIAKKLGVNAVFTNRDYEPQAIERDRIVSLALEHQDIDFVSFKDQVIFHQKEVLTGQGTIFSVFTPFKNAWLKKLTMQDLEPHDCVSGEAHLAPIPKGLQQPMPSLEAMGFIGTHIEKFLPPGISGGTQLFEDFLNRIDHYDTARDFPAIKGPSYLSTHLRFGTVSIRGLVREAHRRMLSGSRGATIWLSELIWRDFYFMILSNHPRLATGASFKPDYDKIEWESGAHAKKLFKAWSDGKTGYPLVDAAMRQLNTSGYMHNRLRMVAACFLIKDLGIDWRWGEAYFAKHLNDFDFSANNGGWQWASSSGCDAQPYFRIFNPITQSEKFDTQGKFIRKYLPELAKLSDKSIHAPWLCGAIELESAEIKLGKDYPEPIVRHDEARTKTLMRYSVVKAPKTSA
jgi:deoxyribodipyrimidine photo-lyase